MVKPNLVYCLRSHRCHVPYTIVLRWGLRVLPGLPSPRGSAGKEWTVLEAAPNSLETTSSDPAPTWGKVLGSLKSWGIAPATQSAAASPTPTRNPQTDPKGQHHSWGQRDFQLCDSDSELNQGQGRALSDTEGLRAPLARRGSMGRKRGGAESDAAQQQDRLRSSLDSTQVTEVCAMSTHNAGCHRRYVLILHSV